MIKLTRPDGSTFYISKALITAIVPTDVHGGKTRVMMQDGSHYDVTEDADTIAALMA